MNSELILAFHSAFSQSESESIRENVSRGLRMAYERGTIQIGTLVVFLEELSQGKVSQQHC